MATAAEIQPGVRVRSTLTGAKGVVKTPVMGLSIQYVAVEYAGGIGMKFYQNLNQLEVISAPKARTAFDPTPETVTKFTDDPQYTDFFEMLNKEASIRVQLPESRHEWFNQRYYNATGEEPIVNVSIIKAEKQGVSITVNFPHKFVGLVPPGVNAWPENTTSPQGKQGFCNIRLAFEMFSKGFRLGTQHNYTGVDGARWLGIQSVGARAKK